MDFELIMNRVWELITLYGLKVLSAIIILVVGRWVAKGVSNLVRGMLRTANVDQAISSFVGHLVNVALFAFFILAALSQVGIQTTSFIAVLGAAGLAIGLALQGSLANFAAGFLMIIFKPFTVGDYIEGAGVAGTVTEIQLFTTTLRTPDNKCVIVPNAKLTGDNIINWTANGTRRVDMVFGIGYGDDIDKARSVMQEVLDQDSRILADPAPLIAVQSLGDSSVDFAVRPWVKVSDYWSVYFETTEKIKKAFDANGVQIPFPQRDVHVYRHEAADLQGQGQPTDSQSGREAPVPLAASSSRS